jgi:hypothetical protein
MNQERIWLRLTSLSRSGVISPKKREPARAGLRSTLLLYLRLLIIDLRI